MVSGFQGGSFVKLIEACRFGNLAEVQFLLQSGAGPNFHAKGGRTPLHEAVSSKCCHRLVEGHRYWKKKRRPREFFESRWSNDNDTRTAIIRLLLEHGACPNAQDSRGWTPLHLAAADGYDAAARLLIEHGANCDARNLRGETPLICAASGKRPLGGGCRVVNKQFSGHTQMALLLLEKGANANIATRSGKTALHYASKNGNSEVVSHLLSLRVNVDQPIAMGSGDSTPRDTDSLRSYPRARILLEDRRGSLDRLRREASGATALHLAASHGHHEIVGMLAYAGANVEAETSNGDTPLCTSFCATIGCRKKALTAHQDRVFETVSTLMRVNVNVNHINTMQESPLSIAINTPGVTKKTVSALLECGANPNCRDNLQMTPLHDAAAIAPELVPLLIKAGANVYAEDVAKRTPLHFVCEDSLLYGYCCRSRERVSRETFEKQGMVRIEAAKAIYQAMQKEQNRKEQEFNNLLKEENLPGFISQVVYEFLIPDVDIREASEKATPLELAHRSGYQELSQLLIGYGADDFAIKSLRRIRA